MATKKLKKEDASTAGLQGPVNMTFKSKKKKVKKMTPGPYGGGGITMSRKLKKDKLDISSDPMDHPNWKAVEHHNQQSGAHFEAADNHKKTGNEKLGEHHDKIGYKHGVMAERHLHVTMGMHPDRGHAIYGHKYMEAADDWKTHDQKVKNIESGETKGYTPHKDDYILDRFSKSNKAGCCGTMIKDKKKLKPGYMLKKLPKPSKMRTQRVKEFLEQKPKLPKDVARPKGSFKLLPKPKLDKGLRERLAEVKQQSERVREAKIKKEVPASPNLGVTMKGKLRKSFNDLWIIRMGDEFQKIADAHQLPFERHQDLQGTEHSWIFKVGECEVSFRTMGRESKIKLDHPKDADDLHLKLAKTIYYKIMIHHEQDPLQKAKRGVAHNIRGREYSRQWQEGLADQKLRQQTRAFGQKRRPQLGTKKPKSSAERRLSRQHLRLFGEQEHVGKAELRKEEDWTGGTKKTHISSSPHHKTHSLVSHAAFDTIEGPEDAHAHAKWYHKQASAGHKIHTSTEEHSETGNAWIHASAWKPKKVKLTKSGRVFIKMLKKAYDEKELGGAGNQEQYRKPKHRKTKKKIKLHPGVYKGFGLAPQRSGLKAPARRGNVNISARAGRPKLNTAIKPATGAPKIITKLKVAIAPMKPTVEKPSIDTKKSDLFRFSKKKKIKRKVKKDAISFSPGFGYGSGQDRF